ncbi:MULTISPECIES: hypothetical protein [Alphaproteobacteria]|uniref:Uncharacterized protein n=2 Tax=Alphaproteobacteria TaxID=28211 RepID=A0A512HPV0_9HYPH|nr:MULTISPECIES: hypothetical protein [Alphaproteobacteria]GEO87475.1 hypothetical protein RNA01_44070 [Ciceribacter naphthalenivorans]GLR23713.1 hypothetical protein GCM10007920_35050 [Ciceribacter naphthalenivorans]GLT06569.1 hypothetical protein GCM10007926_35050 [Sphingomonas psychrolutea]
MMKALNLVLFLALVPSPVFAADFSDPDWPCVQRKVENLSAGLMWPHPITKTQLSPAAEELAATLALRRVSLEEAEAHVRDFVATHPSDEQALGNIFQNVFDRLAENRHRLIGGIAHYSHSQIALAAKIDAAHGEMAKLSAQAKPDFDRIDKLEEEVDWNARIYRDRSRALTYVCETPVLLEKRAYAIAQILLRQLPQ